MLQPLSMVLKYQPSPIHGQLPNQLMLAVAIVKHIQMFHALPLCDARCRWLVSWRISTSSMLFFMGNNRVSNSRTKPKAMTMRKKFSSVPPLPCSKRCMVLIPKPDWMDSAAWLKFLSRRCCFKRAPNSELNSGAVEKSKRLIIINYSIMMFYIHIIAITVQLWLHKKTNTGSVNSSSNS